MGTCFSAPPLCGAVPALSSTVAEFGDHVVALVPEPDVAAAAVSLSEGCILAEVVSYDYDKKMYEVEDVDAEEGKMLVLRYEYLKFVQWLYEASIINNLLGFMYKNSIIKIIFGF